MKSDTIKNVAYVTNHGPHRWAIHWYDQLRRAWWEPAYFHHTKKGAVEFMHEEYAHKQERERRG